MLEDYRMTVTTPECLPSAVTVAADIEIEDDIGDLMPYLNAVMGPGIFDSSIPFLRINRDGRLIVFYQRKIGIAGLRDENEAEEAFEKIREMINTILSTKDEIKPSYWSLSELKPLDIFKQLPGTNCGECDRPTCFAFAAALANGEAIIEDCPPLSENEWIEKRASLLAMFGKSE